MQKYAEMLDSSHPQRVGLQPNPGVSRKHSFKPMFSISLCLVGEAHPYLGEHGSQDFHYSSGFPGRCELSDPTSEEDKQTKLGLRQWDKEPANISVSEAEKGAEGNWSSTGPSHWAGSHTHLYRITAACIKPTTGL